MTSKFIGMREDKGTSVCNCGGSLVYQDEWDRLFDYYDEHNTPSHDLVYNRIHNEDNQPKYICDKCSLEVFVIPDYALRK
ncbi:hypothetical protein [Lysinibacillus capsici]|uniref:hypothetical protein n=1 Tax=Lysinibacillus capsici TaxID=2115968 RepID=UPI002A80CA65|nr:hypothetical protein [Lysinibacillus capsici]